MHKLQILISASAFVSTHSIHLLYASKERQIQRNHAIKQQNSSKKKKKGQKYKLFNKKVDFLLVDSIRINKFVAEIFTHLLQLKEILTISPHPSFTKSYRK